LVVVGGEVKIEEEVEVGGKRETKWRMEKN